LSQSPVAGAVTVACQPPPRWTTTDAKGSQVPLAPTLSCDKAVAAAKVALGGDPAVYSIEFGYGPWCPPGAFCVLSLPNSGHVVFHRSGHLPDILVAVTADDAGNVTAAALRPLPTASPSAS
jgi:hypothetical protein